MKIDPFRQTDSEPDKRARRPRDDDAPKAEDKAPRKWKEPEGFFQGARVKRR
jgi:hypothetical protein